MKKSIIVITIIFVIYLILALSLPAGQLQDVQSMPLLGSILGSILEILLVPGGIALLFITPMSCRDETSSFPSLIECPNLIFAKIALSYLGYLVFMPLMILIYRKIVNWIKSAESNSSAFSEKFTFFKSLLIISAITVVIVFGALFVFVSYGLKNPLLR